MHAETFDILYVITDLQRGGVPLHLHRLIAAVRDARYRTAVVSLAPGGEVAELLRADRVEVLDCGGRGGWDVRVILRLARILRALNPRLVHSFLFHANLAVRAAGRLVGYPTGQILCEIQTVEVERRWHLALDHATHEWCRFTIGNSPSVVEHLSRAAGIPMSSLMLVRGGIEASRKGEPELRRKARESLETSTAGVSSDVPWVLWVGRLDPVKGLDVLINAFSAVIKKTKAHLLLAGDGSMYSALRQQIVSCNLENVVHLLGMRRDVSSLLQTADLFVFPSRTEGLPNALLEAMAAGIPIVTTDVPGCRDLIQDRSNGRLVPVDDPSALAAAMVELLSENESASKLALRAKADADSLWDIRHTHSKYLSVYQSILSETSPT